ncbi:MAG: glutamate--tRNA ligase [Deltaproteobacteria bacterium]|nr:MAG: glutamate--tRNA ligase [Deltaproteobacteria bacterium]
MSVVTRFAPSPTGSLHVGGARTALYCLLHARHFDGTFLLRIEDTDRARSTVESTVGILRDLAWLGLEWDEGPGKDRGHGPYFQSERLHLYGPYFDQLLAEGHAYEAFDTREELQAAREAALATKQDFRYRDPGLSPEQIEAFKAEGRPSVLRLRAPDHAIRVHDEVLGEVVTNATHLEDIVIRKADGYPTYHFGVVIDDTLMKVTLVMRGQEHLLNTPKHLGLYQALGWEPPAYAHLPLIFNPQGSKMSKRDKARHARAEARKALKERGEDIPTMAARIGVEPAELQDFMKKKSDSIPTSEAIASDLGLELPMIEVMDFRRAGYLPEALNNYLALLGWNPGPDPTTGEEREIFSLDELIERWDLARVGKTSARFDPEKLRWMNGEYLRSLPDEVLSVRLEQWLEVCDSALPDLPRTLRRAVITLYRPRANTFCELEAAARWMWTPPTDYNPKAVKKWIRRGEGLQNLRAARAVLDRCPWTEDALEEALTGLAQRREVKLGFVAQPIRIALSGDAATPGLWEVLVALDRTDVIARIDRCLEALEAP